ncbi:protein of unknown function [Paraburkholderia dioscoreae]|uniref:Uncharacterized protein n=1 Tax=Paraburkholderia dioscoreae TaxID=2604047 RepID=A0A5Q4ZHJ1_9BURK|nr:protein of unknown function [Paraburkholderia dioscoreae]
MQKAADKVPQLSDWAQSSNVCFPAEGIDTPFFID